MQILQNMVIRYNKFEKYFLTTMMAVLVIVVFLQVFTRYAMNNSLVWSEEVARYLFQWLSWYGISIGFLEREHIRVGLLPTYLEKKDFKRAEILLWIIIDLIWLYACYRVTSSGLEVTISHMALNMKSPTVHFPYALVVVCIPLGNTVLGLRLIGDLCKHVRNLVAAIKSNAEGGKKL